MIRKERKARWVYRCSPCDYTSPASVDMFGAQEWQQRHDRERPLTHAIQGITRTLQPVIDAYASLARTFVVADEPSQEDFALVPPIAPVRPLAQLACGETVWDGPYKMTCGYLIVFGKCVRHGAGGLTYIVPSDSPALRSANKDKA